MSPHPKFTHLFWTPEGEFKCAIMVNTFWDQLCNEQKLSKAIRAQALSGQTDNGSSTFVLITPSISIEIFGELPMPSQTSSGSTELQFEENLKEEEQLEPLSFIASEEQANALYHAAKLGLEIDEYFNEALRDKAKEELFAQARLHKSEQPDLEPKCDAFDVDSFILDPVVQKEINKSKQWREEQLRNGALKFAILGDATEGRPVIIRTDWTGPVKKGKRKFKGETKDGEAFDADPEPIDSGPPPAGSLADRIRCGVNESTHRKGAKGRKATIDDRSTTTEKPRKPKKKKRKKKSPKTKVVSEGINSPIGLVDATGRALPSKRINKKKRNK